MSDNAKYSLASLRDNGIEMSELLSVLWQSKKLIVALTLIFFGAGIVYSFTLPNTYKAQAILAPADDSNSNALSGVAGQFGGLASLAGVSLPGSGVDRVTVAMEVLRSRVFIADFINKRDISIPLMAAKHWNGKEVVLDSDIYNTETSSWGDDFLIDGNKNPTDWDLYDAFMDITKASQDKTTGLVTVSIEHISPVLARDWVDWLITDLNQHIKDNDVKEAQTSVVFLEEQIKKTPVADMQKMFFQLIEKQYQTIMLANVREQYMFKVLDPAVIPQNKSNPKRALIIIVYSLFGFMLGVATVLINVMWRQGTKSSS